MTPTYSIFWAVADPKILKGAEDNLSVPSSFIANTHNELYAFYTEKGGFLKKKFWANRGGADALTASPFESATGFEHLK